MCLICALERHFNAVLSSLVLEFDSSPSYVCCVSPNICLDFHPSIGEMTSSLEVICSYLVSPSHPKTKLRHIRRR